MKTSNQLIRFLFEVILIGAILFLGFIDKAFSQDIIIKRNGIEIRAKVIEIQETVIKYKFFDFLEGPMRNISISEVSEIKYEKGNVEHFVQFQPVVQTAAAITTQEVSVEEPSANYPLRAVMRIAVQDWHNPDLSDYYGNNTLFGFGIEKQLSDDFKLGIDSDFSSKKKEGYTLKYTQLGAYIKYAWYPFGSNRPNVCGGLGAKSIFLSEEGDGEVVKGNSFGFSALLGVEIPLGESFFLDLGWNSVWSKMNCDNEVVDVGSEMYSAGIIFNF
jgi:hypothetical protein